LDVDYAEAAVDTVLAYQMSWPDHAYSGPMTVACDVTGGTCSVAGVDAVARTATIEWTLPASPDDHEVRVSAGNATFFISAADRVVVRP